MLHQLKIEPTSGTTCIPSKFGHQFFDSFKETVHKVLNYSSWSQLMLSSWEASNINMNEVSNDSSGSQIMFCSWQASDIKEYQVHPFIDYLFNPNFCIGSRLNMIHDPKRKVKIVQKYYFYQNQRSTTQVLWATKPDTLITQLTTFCQAWFTTLECCKKLCSAEFIHYSLSKSSFGKEADSAIWFFFVSRQHLQQNNIQQNILIG